MTPSSGRVVVVTGGGRGIGRAVALHLGAVGWSVLVLDSGCRIDGAGSDPSIAAETAERIVTKGGVARAAAVDVTRSSDVDDALRAAGRDWGSIDAVVNAAGVLRLNNVLTATDDDWQQLFDVHVRGSFHVCRAAIRGWQARGSSYGRIVNFTSTAGLEGIPDMLVYSTVKAGVIGLTLALANSLAGAGLTVNAVAPTGASRMAIRGLGDEALAVRRTTGNWPTLDAVDPADVAPLVEYLLSEAANDVTGRIFTNYGPRYAALHRPVEAATCVATSHLDATREISIAFGSIGSSPTRWRVNELGSEAAYDFPIDELD